jgi:hypothetical protein
VPGPPGPQGPAGPQGAAGSGGTPGGTDKQLQFNNAGAFGGIAKTEVAGGYIAFGNSPAIAIGTVATFGYCGTMFSGASGCAIAFGRVDYGTAFSTVELGSICGGGVNGVVAAADSGYFFSAVAGGSGLLTNRDIGLMRDGAGQLAQRERTTPQSFRVYNTADSIGVPTNYECGVFDWTTTANMLTIGAQKGGTGTIRDVSIVKGTDVFFTSASSTVAGLPVASATLFGARRMVTDANAATFNTTAAGGGSNKVPVFCDGAAWKIG